MTQGILKPVCKVRLMIANQLAPLLSFIIFSNYLLFLITGCYHIREEVSEPGGNTEGGSGGGGGWWWWSWLPNILRFRKFQKCLNQHEAGCGITRLSSCEVISCLVAQLVCG